ncbi:MAG: cysteine--tRNA ligase, partial [Nitrosomonadales bacterium]|nr:cysteine--tRNA ligase [Nitrosomonadales bacterium]MBT6603036.1 cysteine--tRNA ligase [Nitrosomonadales bacterium]
AHYRSPLNFSQKNLAEAKQALTKLYLSVRNFKLDKEFKINWNSKFANDFKKALDDDFNTAEAIAILFELALKVNKNQNIEDINLLIKLGNVLGILSQDAEVFLKDNVNKGIDVEKIIRQRDEAKASKDYVTADKLRDDLLENDILIEDTPTGTVWRKK